VEKFDEQGKPVRVKVLSTDYEIIWMDAATVRMSDKLGSHDGWMSKIHLVAEMSEPTALAGDFLHELFHALYCLSASFDAENFNQEHAARIVSTGMTAFWRDNPLTFKWWQSLLEDR
jgi:hypothetical protein